MTTTTDVSPSADNPGTPERPANSRPSRLNQALAWVGIVAGGLLIVGAVFFSGFFLSWSLSGDTHRASAPMDCCADMKPGEPMKAGAMMPPAGQMKPGEPMKPGEMMPGMMGPQPPTSAPPNTPRP